MQIAFWSNFHGQTCTTSNLIAIGIMTALDYRLRTLVTQNHFDKNALDYFILSKRFINSELTELSDSGIDALSRFIKFNKVSKEDFANYTTTLLNNKLDLLMGTKGTNRELYKNEFNSVIEMILNSAKKYYDLIFVDISAGNNKISKNIISKSDLLVVNICQNSIIIDDLFDNYNNLLENNNVFYLVGRYDKDSRLNVKNIKRRYGLKDNIAFIPNNIEFSDSLSEGKVIDFFIKNMNVKKDDPNYYFIEQTRIAVESLLTKLSIDINNKKLGD